MSDSPASTSTTKVILRAAALAKRDALSSAQRDAAALAIAARGLPVAIRPGMVVSGYSPIRSELDPIPLMRALAAQGARLALPVIAARDRPLSFRAWSSGDGLARGPQQRQGTVVMSGAVADPVAQPVERRQRHQHDVGNELGRLRQRFENTERAARQPVA